MKETVGNRGLVGRELPSNFIGVHWLAALIITISLIGSIVLLLVFIRQQNDESFKRFIQVGKAGVYQGVIMSPLANPNTHKYEGTWQVEIAGAGDNTLQSGVIREGK